MIEPKFQKLLSRKHATFVDSILINAWNEKERFEKIANFSEYVQNLEIVDGDFYFDTNWVEEIIAKYSDRNPSVFTDFVMRGYENGEKLIAFTKDISSSKDDTLTIFKKSVELVKNLLVFLSETHPLSKTIERKLISFFKADGLADEKIHDLLMSVSKPVKLNGPALEVKELAEIKNKKWENEQDKEKALEAHAEKFEYLGYREPFSKGYDVEFFKGRLNSVEDNSGKPADIGIKISKECEEYIGLMQEYVYFRNYRTEKLYEALYVLEPEWQKVSIELGLGSHDIFFYLEKEINDLLNSGIKVDDKILEERRKGHAFLLNDNHISLITGDALATHKKMREGVIASTDTIKGMAACRGLAKGRVKIIIKASEQSKIEEGDILVAPMTTPDYIPCMEKAVAFVTDEGGITCHAAIIAREMKKPCIIGTKNATKILKDGDMVEVDADKGIVKILNK